MFWWFLPLVKTFRRQLCSLPWQTTEQIEKPITNDKKHIDLDLMIMCGFWFSWRVEALRDWPSTEKERGKHRKTREGRGKAKEKERGGTEKGSF